MFPYFYCMDTDFIEEEREKAQLLQTLKGKETITGDGRKINLYANIASVGDVGYVLELSIMHINAESGQGYVVSWALTWSLRKRL